MITIDQIRQKIIEGIKQSGLTQTEIARRLGIGQQMISEYIRGKSLPALDTLANLCVVLDLDANDILCVSSSSGGVTITNSFNNIGTNTGVIKF